MIRDLRVVIFALATCSFLSISVAANDYSNDAADEAALYLEDGTYADFFFGQGWYAGLGIANSRFCNLPVNALLPMCLTGLVAPVITWPGRPNFGHGGRRGR